tara:strand:- start:2448 stop:2894 length:447 start_codon:yes stop_codon:yes gene_type:complete
MQKINLKEMYDIANKHYLDKDYKKAKDLYLNILKHSPQHPETNNNLGLTYRKLNQIEDAIFCFKTALKSNENYVIALNNLAKAQLAINLISESIINFEKSLKLDPNKKETLEEYAATLLKADNHNKALRYLNKAVGTINFSHEKVYIV